ncbi:putative Structural constituent of cell wall [Melia azedarach]|uniref:Structural constituent of cell wall n=1 Tax=Melia azedarach TaxID=155640 RepID=A0ACC1Z319_MELAZ|nr:putative Structural constituent of cell wall [Melia azedarach]
MASGSSGRANSGSKGFDFASDDILCSYEDYPNDSSNGNHSDPTIGPTSSKDFHKSRRARPSMFSASGYSQPEDSLNQDVIATVEIAMKKHTDNLMRFLEGISSRLSQLELYCYNLDKSIGEMRSDLGRDHGEADTKLKSLEKHLQEVHRSVQILRDKQELAETQKELAKLQLAHKDSSSSNHSQSNEERASPAASDAKRNENTSDMQNQQLALALPHQVAPQQQPVPPPSQPPPQIQGVAHQQTSYYMPAPQIPNPPAPAPAPSQQPQGQYLSSDPQYRPPQLPDPSRMAPQPTQSQPNPVPPSHQFPPQYQQQWPQQVQQTQQPSMQPQIRPSSPAVYPSYAPSQPTNPPPPEMLQNSAPMQVPYSGVAQPVSSRPDVMPYGYGTPGRTVPQQAPPLPPAQQIKANYGAQPGDGYAAGGPLPTLPPGSAYMMYDSESGRTHHPGQQSQFAQGGFAPQPTAGTNLLARNPNHSQFVRNHPYNDLIEKLVNMGFRGDHAASVIQRMEESGQPVDFNSVLDRLSPHSSAGSQRGWSG